MPTLGDVAAGLSSPPPFQLADPLRLVLSCLDNRADLPGVLVQRPDGEWALLSRATLTQRMSRGFARELYTNRPIEHLLESWPGAALILDRDTSVSDAVSLAVSRPQPDSFEPVVCREPDGSMRLVELRVLLIELTRILSTTTAEAAAQRDAAQAASRAKTDFLTNVSHEIRTPMTAVVGYSDLLLDHELPPDRREEYVKAIHCNGRQLLSIVTDLLDIANLYEGRTEIEQSSVSPEAVARDAMAEHEAAAQGKGLQLDIEIAPNVPTSVVSDPARIRQVLNGLIENAVKFTEHGRVSLRVTWSAASRSLGFVVADTGVGMSDEELTRISQPFSQADTSVSRRYGGLGRGLSLSRRLVELLGGNLSITSRRGQGTMVTVEIPASSTDARDADTGTPLRSMVQSNGLSGVAPRVLIAEDGLDNQRLISHHVKKAGMQVELAENGQIAIQMFNRAASQGRPFDLVFMDMQMPELDGYQATMRLRSRGVTTPIIAVTAHAMSGDRERCLAAGCNEYMAKPLDFPALILLAKRLIAERRHGATASPATRSHTGAQPHRAA